MTAPTYVQCQALWYEYPHREEEESFEALRGVEFQAARGEFVAVLGHNGSGKSTLARHLNALLLPTKGDVAIKGMDTRDEALLWEIRKSVGMVFQNPDNQIVAAVVEDDVAFGPENVGLPPEEIRRRVENALETVGMEGYADRAPHMLSGGQKQRIAIAGVLALRPDIIVMDEPTAMLDPIGRREVLATCETLVEEGITVILITHYMEEAARAHRIVVMDEGEVLMDAPPEQVFARRDELLASGLELPPLRELKYLLAQDGLVVEDSINDIEGMARTICRSISRD